MTIMVHSATSPESLTRSNNLKAFNRQVKTIMESAIYQVSAFWDAEEAVWVATSEDVPGLATEADTIEALSQKLRDIVPDLLLSNHVISANYAGSITIQLTSQRQKLIEVAS